MYVYCIVKIYNLLITFTEYKLTRSNVYKPTILKQLNKLICSIDKKHLFNRYFLRIGKSVYEKDNLIRINCKES